MRSTNSYAPARRSSLFHARPYPVIILSLLILAMPLAGFAQTQTKPRPVARLITSSSQVTPEPRRARQVTSTSTRERTTTAPSASSNSGGVYALASASSLERRAFDLVNEERRARGEAPLVWDAELSRMARTHSNNMAQSGYLDHRSPDGLDMAERARSMGIRGWRALGENVALNQGYSDPSGFAVQRWMGSPKHRSNILSSQFTRTGIGVARGADGSIYFTQVFMS